MEALTLAEGLSVEYSAASQPYRHGQVLIEMAEAQQDLGLIDDVTATLERAAPLYEERTGLEALRRRTHLARNTIDRGAAPAYEAELLASVLSIAAQHDRADLTRTMLALHQLTRLSARGAVCVPLLLAASRASLTAADLQRDSIRESGTRFALLGLRHCPDPAMGGYLRHSARGRGGLWRIESPASAEDVDIVQRSCSADASQQWITGSQRVPCQRWQFRPPGNDIYKIVNPYTREVLDVLAVPTLSLSR